jgi:hypothetical protein
MPEENILTFPKYTKLRTNFLESQLELDVEIASVEKELEDLRDSKFEEKQEFEEKTNDLGKIIRTADIGVLIETFEQNNYDITIDIEHKENGSVDYKIILCGGAKPIGKDIKFEFATMDENIPTYTLMSYLDNLNGKKSYVPVPGRCIATEIELTGTLNEQGDSSNIKYKFKLTAPQVFKEIGFYEHARKLLFHDVTATIPIEKAEYISSKIYASHLNKEDMITFVSQIENTINDFASGKDSIYVAKTPKLD